MYAVKKVKDLNIPSILKCLQVIKTKKNIYLIYERYPAQNLEQYVFRQRPHLTTSIFSKLIRIGVCEENM